MLSALPLGVLVALVWYYAVDVFTWDEWEIIRLLEKFHDGTLTFWDIFRQHNEHRIILAKIIPLISAIYFRGNVYLGHAVNVLAVTLTSIVIYYAISKLDNLNQQKRMILYFTSACLIFSFSQQFNFLFGMQIAVFSCVFLSILACAFLVWGGRAGMIGAMLSAFAATFQFANGMMAWPAGFVIICLSGYVSGKKFPYAKLLVWSAVSAAGICLYFWGLRLPVSDMKSILTKPHMAVILFITYLGAPLSAHRESIALAAGLAGLALQFWSFSRIFRERNRNVSTLFWTGLDVYVLLSAAVTVIGRSEGISASMADRYLTIQIVFWLATIGLLSIALDSRDKLSIAWYVVCGLMICSLSVSEAADVREAFKYQMAAGKYDNEHYRRYIFPFGAMPDYIPKLREWGIRNFENAPQKIDYPRFSPAEFDAGSAAMSPGTSAGIEEISAGKRFIELEAWWKIDAFVERDRDCAQTYMILCGKDGAFEALLTDPPLRHKSRIVRKPPEEYERKRVWAAYYDYSDLPSGTYSIFLKVILPDKEYILPLTQTLTLE